MKKNFFHKYLELDDKHADKVQEKSQFMDQGLYPYETQHILKEIVEIFDEMGVELVSTFINHFEKIYDVEKLYQMGQGLYDEGMGYLKKREYYPRFSYVLEKKKQ